MMELKKRSDGVDLLRGIAILLVLILHFHLTYRLHVLPFDVPWLSGAIKAISRNGNYGVTMFFAVSGFLITSTSARRFGSLGAIRPATFYRFRASRILPCLVLVLAVIVALGSLGMRSFVNKPDTASVLVSVLSVLTFWHNVLMAKVGYFNYSMNILWSLSVEEVFYLSFPILCLLLKRRRYILLFLCVPILVAPVYRSLHADDEIVALYGYLSCFDAIAMGACAALLPARAMSRGRS
ncbi:acyltransferase family protein, partial [Burkholderia pseudomallei]